MRSLFWAAATVALFAVPASASAAILVTIDKTTQRMTVEMDGQPLYTWPVSTGRRGYDTPSGSFKAFRMEADHYSKEWDDAPMPHSIFFTQVGHAIHGTYETRHLGVPVSHGCVRLSPEHAKVLFNLVKQDGVTNTRVVLRGDIPNGRGVPMATRRQPQVAEDFDGSGDPAWWAASQQRRYDYRDNGRSRGAYREGDEIAPRSYQWSDGPSRPFERRRNWGWD